MKCLDLKPGHVIADVGSGTGTIGKVLYELSGLENPIRCVDRPAWKCNKSLAKRKEFIVLLKRPKNFFSDPQISESFDRVIAVTSVHHFVNPDVAFKGTLRSLRSGTICLG